MKFHGSFGGPQTLITSVTIKCNDFGEPDIVSISLVVELTVPRLLHLLEGYNKLDIAIKRKTMKYLYNLFIFVLRLDAR